MTSDLYKLYLPEGHRVALQERRCAHCPVSGNKVWLHDCTCGFTDACSDCMQEHIRDIRHSGVRTYHPKPDAMIGRRSKATGIAIVARK